MVKKILRVIFWPFHKFLEWLASDLPKGPKRKGKDE